MLRMIVTPGYLISRKMRKDVETFEEDLRDVVSPKTDNIRDADGVRGRKTERSMCHFI